MFKKQIDILSIGDVTTDAFIRLEKAEVHCDVNKIDCEICMPFGEKIPFEYVKVVKAVGNAANAAVCAARLGLRSALVSNVGNDQNGQDSLKELQKNGVVTTFIKVNQNKPTNYHFVLWYDEDRTILTKHTEYDYRLPDAFDRHTAAGKYSTGGLPPKWIYLTSLATDTFPYHMAIADYLDDHPEVRLAFQPGTFQLQLGPKELKRIYARTDIFIVNMAEAKLLLKKDSAGKAVNDVKDMMKRIAAYGPKMVAITDNTDGAYLYDGERYYHIPMYPDARPAFERTGCGDAWASTFVSALCLGRSPLEALVWAPVNPMSVAQFIGSQEGLLTREQLEWWLERAPDGYKPREI
jgi:sugar/nucleoside kinase (ribokinase family)